ITDCQVGPSLTGRIAYGVHLLERCGKRAMCAQRVAHRALCVAERKLAPCRSSDITDGEMISNRCAKGSNGFSEFVALDEQQPLTSLRLSLQCAVSASGRESLSQRKFALGVCQHVERHGQVTTRNREAREKLVGRVRGDRAALCPA